MSLVIGPTESHGGHPEPGRRAARPAGKPTSPKPVGHGPRHMPSTTVQCTNCGVVLNLPEKVEGRRLKCPKCGVKFQVGPTATGSKPVPSSPTSADLNPNSTLLLSRQPSSGDLPVMPTASGDLRDSFDLPMMTEAAPARPGGKGGASGGPAGGEHADALALFEDSPQPRRKKTGAEARASARRCPTCGGVVPVGMSICQKCGLDLESGTRVDLADDLSPPPPPKPPGPSIPMTVVGSLCLAVSAALSAFAFFKWNAGLAGAIYFVPLALFGIFASVQFLRGKTVKLLLVALTLGAVMDLTFMIGAPIIKANEEAAPIERTISSNDDAELEREIIKPYAERLDASTISKGIGLLFLYAGISIYLISPSVQKHMRKV